MTVTAKLADGRTLQFPDGTDPEVVQTTVRKLIQADLQRKSGDMALEGMSGTDKFLAGTGKGMTDVVQGVKQLLGAGDRAAVDESRNRDAALGNTPAGMAGEVTGNVALTAIPGVGAQGLLARGAAAVLPRMIAPIAGAAGAGGLLGAATTPLGTGDTRGGAATTGAIGGAAGDLGARAASRVVQPILQSPAVRRLLGEGVVPTPGQAAGADSFLGRAEQKIQSLFGVGDIVKIGRDRAGTEFNLAAINRAVPPGQPQATAIGQEGVDQARQAISAQYDRALAGRTMRPDADLHAGLTAARDLPVLPLNAERERQYDSIMRRVVWERIPAGGDLPAPQVKMQIDHDLGQLAHRLSRSPMAEEQALGDAVRGARDAVREWMNRQTGGGAERVAADAAYANRVGVANAVERARAAGGKFTPNQLQMTTRDGTPLRALANDAQSVLGSRVPDSGTVGRGTLAALLLSGGGVGANEYFGGPGYLSALAAAPLVYSRAGSRYAIGNLVPGQQTLAELLRNTAPFSAQVGRGYAQERNR